MLRRIAHFFLKSPTFPPSLQICHCYQYNEVSKRKTCVKTTFLSKESWQHHVHLLRKSMQMMNYHTSQRSLENKALCFRIFDKDASPWTSNWYTSPVLFWHFYCSLPPQGCLWQLLYQPETHKMWHAFTAALELNSSMLRNSCMQAIKRRAKTHMGMNWSRRKLPQTETVAWPIVQIHHHCSGFLGFFPCTHQILPMQFVFSLHRHLLKALFYSCVILQ